MIDILDFLPTVPILREFSAQELDELLPYLKCENRPAGTLILRQGEHNSSLYILRSGRLAVSVRRVEGYETVAYLQPPTVFGELSFVTGRTCSADVQVVVDAEVLSLSRELHRVSLLDFSRSPEIIRAGEKVTEENLPAILASYKSLKAAVISSGSTKLVDANTQAFIGGR